jgi:O-antigen/teichoic acid export membrane protein
MAETNMKSHPLLHGRLLARNVVWNLIGTGSPLLVAVFSIPILLHRLGTDRFGVIALAWTLIGYAGLFDLGLGRALTKLVSEKLGNGREQEIPELFWTSQTMMLALGLAGASLFALGIHSQVYGILKIPTALQTDALRAFYALAISIPIVISTAGLRGFLEAQQSFGLINLIRVPMGIFSFAGPLLVLPFSDHIFPITVVLVVGRVVAWAAHLFLCFLVMPVLAHELAVRPQYMRTLFTLGGWMTVSNVVGPTMLYMDRFVIGALVSAAAVTYYASPYEVVTKLLIVSGAVSAVMFPAFSLSSAQDSRRLRTLYRSTTLYILSILIPLTAVLVAIARPGLSLWLGSNFSMHSYRTAQLLLVGTLALAVGALPFALLQGLGRPDIPAKLNLVELPFYAAALYWFIQTYGVTGAAAAWMLRASADAALLMFFAHRIQTDPIPQRVGTAVESVTTL